MATQTRTRSRIAASSGNVFADLGLPSASELDTKVRLAVEINRLIDARKLSQVKVAALLEIGQAQASALKHYKLDGFSSARLMSFLLALGQDLEIHIKPRRTAGSPGRILVCTTA